MTEVKYMYKVYLPELPTNKIEKVEILREDADFIYLRYPQGREDTHPKSLDNVKFFDTWEKAKAALMEARMRDVAELHKQLERSQRAVVL